MNVEKITTSPPPNNNTSIHFNKLYGCYSLPLYVADPSSASGDGGRGRKRWSLVSKAFAFLVGLSISKKLVVLIPNNNTQQDPLLPTTVFPRSPASCTSITNTNTNTNTNTDLPGLCLEIKDPEPEPEPEPKPNKKEKKNQNRNRNRNDHTCSASCGRKRWSVAYKAISFLVIICLSRKAVLIQYNNKKKKGFLSFFLEALKETTIIIHLAVLLISMCSGIVNKNGVKQGWWYDGASMFVAVFLAISLSAFSNFIQCRQLDDDDDDDDYHHQQQTPLQARVEKLTFYLSFIGLVVASLVFLGLIIGHFTGRNDQGNTKTKIPSEVINAVVNIISVAVPEGLPLAITLSLIYSMKKLMANRHALVRKLAACETMGSVTTICTDKTGILTLNQIEVSEFWMDIEAQVQKPSDLATDVRELLQQAIGLNSSSSDYCSPTYEKAVSSWAVVDLGLEIDEVKQSHEILHVEDFKSEKNQSRVVVRKKLRRENSSIKVQVHWKGAAEMILPMCSSYYDRKGVIITMDDEGIKQQFMEINRKMASKSLRCVAFAHKSLQNLEEDEDDDQSGGLTLLGLVGLKASCLPGVREAIESCKNAGVDVKMFTRDSLETSKAIGIECGILKLDDNDDESYDDEALLIEGKEFKNYSQQEKLEKIERIKIMARSSTMDKLDMVKCLKTKGHIVAVTTGNCNDIVALKEADVGLSMGNQGTEVAKERSDIIILDNNFTSIVTVVRSGRCLFNNIQKFIQFHLTVNVAALLINLVGAVSLGNVPFTPAQLLWVNLIMDILGAVALATEQPTEDDLMNKKPPAVSRSSEPLITKVMWRNLVAQALYQMIVILTLQFKGKSIFDVEDDKVKGTIVFNCFVLCQVFNEFNARKLKSRNIFEGILGNKLFLGIVGTTILLQVVMVEWLAKFADTKRLSWGQWTACVAFAAFTWPIAWVAKGIPV